MGIATEEQMKRMNEAIERDASRPLVERLRDPKNHYPAALRIEAANRIAELEQLLAVRPQNECTERMTVQPDGSLRCHHCGHVVPTSTKSD